MKITPVAGPSTIPISGTDSPRQKAAVERATAAFMKGTPAEKPPSQGLSTPNPSFTPQSQEPMSEFEKALQAQNRQRNNIQEPEAIAQGVESDVTLPSEESKEVAKEEVPTEKLSSQYAILARKEKANRMREQQLRQRESNLKAREAALSPSKPEAPSFDPSKYIEREKLMQNPFGVLTEQGLTYDQLTEAAMNAPSPQHLALMNQVKAMEAKIAKMTEDQESSKKTFQEQQDQGRKQALKQIKYDVTNLVNANPDYETIKETGSIDDVVELIDVTLKKDGIYLSVDEAARQVEEYLAEEAFKLTRLKKIQQRLQPKAPSVEKPTEQPQQQQMKTLTNSVSASRQLSARERAILAFNGKLSK